MKMCFLDQNILASLSGVPGQNQDGKNSTGLKLRANFGGLQYLKTAFFGVKMGWD